MLPQKTEKLLKNIHENVMKYDEKLPNQKANPLMNKKEEKFKVEIAC